jgi:TfoX/Sxy family transcriptional regulator of competence genes
MATKASTVEYIVDQLLASGDITTKKMFGEYALYCDGKVVAFICDDTLFVKITAEGKAFAGELYKEGPAYPGSKPYLVVDEDQIEDREWLTELISITAQYAPAPKLKKKK